MLAIERPDMSTAQLVRPLAELSGRSVRFIEDCQGPEANRAISTMLPGNIGILENTRFHTGEEKNDQLLARGMAELGILDATERIYQTVMELVK